MMDSQKPLVNYAWQPVMWRLDAVPKKIYVAAPMTEQGTAARLALQLIDAGFDVTSRWLRKDFSDKPSKDDFSTFAKYEAEFGRIDMEDVAAADTLIVLAANASTSGGYHFELGYYLGLGKTNIVVVGDRPNVFFFTPPVRYVPSAEGLVEWLKDSEHGQVDVDEIKLGTSVEDAQERWF
jgi:nucleoside 2-deoxyribosyltransferase